MGSVLYYWSNKSYSLGTVGHHWEKGHVHWGSVSMYGMSCSHVNNNKLCTAHDSHEHRSEGQAGLCSCLL